LVIGSEFTSATMKSTVRGALLVGEAAAPAAGFRLS